MCQHASLWYLFVCTSRINKNMCKIRHKKIIKIIHYLCIKLCINMAKYGLISLGGFYIFILKIFSTNLLIHKFSSVLIVNAFVSETPWQGLTQPDIKLICDWQSTMKLWQIQHFAKEKCQQNVFAIFCFRGLSLH